MKQDFAILAVNMGSSTLKFAAYPAHNHHVENAMMSGNISGLEPGGSAEVSWSNGDVHVEEDILIRNTQDPFLEALEYLKQLLAKELAETKILAVAHRVVHGGQRFSKGTSVNQEVIDYLMELKPLAPLHQPHNIEGIKVFSEIFKDLPQIACFDTAFHTTIPSVEKNFAIPKELQDQGIYRYGFHGLSYQYVITRLLKKSAAAKGRVLMAHLGNGSSLCAANHGVSVASSMGFSAVDGLMMGTRCGHLDPGVILFLLEKGWDHSQIQNLIYKNSGLKGVSGISADMRTLRASQELSARLAIEMYTHRVVKGAGAMIACMEGLDVIAFTGGIGEHDTQLRKDVCQKLSYLGVVMDDSLNQMATGSSIMPIHASTSKVQIWVVPTDEGRVAAEEAMSLLGL